MASGFGPEGCYEFFDRVGAVVGHGQHRDVGLLSLRDEMPRGSAVGR